MTRAAALLAAGAACAALACTDPPSAPPAPSPEREAAPAAAQAPRVVVERPPAATWDADRPAYASAAELCAYVNAARVRGKEHARFRGEPWRGAYHQSWTWPIELARDSSLDADAQAEAERLAAAGAPRGRMSRDSAWRRPVWFDGIGSERLQLAAQDQPGDWDPARDVEARAALIETNGAVRLGLLHQDGGGEAPVMRRIGCGDAWSTDRRARWWVVVVAP